MARERDPLDPKGLLREAYRIDGITAEECRSIFFDWALSLPDGTEAQEAIGAYLARGAHPSEDHPMTRVLREGEAQSPRPRRRGGWRSRPRD